MKDNNYIENDDIMAEWEKWVASSPDPSKRMPTELLGQQIMTIAEHLLTSSQFHGYPKYAKDEMLQEGALKCLKNLKNFKPEKGSIFSYLTLCCHTAFITYLGKYYHELNQKRELLLEALEKQQTQGGITQTQGAKELIRLLRLCEQEFKVKDKKRK